MHDLPQTFGKPGVSAIAQSPDTFQGTHAKREVFLYLSCSVAAPILSHVIAHQQAPFLVARKIFEALHWVRSSSKHIHPRGRAPMASKAARSATTCSQHALQCYRHSPSGLLPRPIASRALSTSTPRLAEGSPQRPVPEPVDGLASLDGVEGTSEPRWKRTPPRMKAPFSVYERKDPNRRDWKVNEDPNKLRHAYERFVGHDVAKGLPEELQFLAVTHKSFDQGRRGFNTKLAFLGKCPCGRQPCCGILLKTAPTEPMTDLALTYRAPNYGARSHTHHYVFHSIADDCGIYRCTSTRTLPTPGAGNGRQTRNPTTTGYNQQGEAC